MNTFELIEALGYRKAIKKEIEQNPNFLDAVLDRMEELYYEFDNSTISDILDCFYEIAEEDLDDIITRLSVFSEVIEEKYEDDEEYPEDVAIRLVNLEDLVWDAKQLKEIPTKISDLLRDVDVITNISALREKEKGI